MRLLLILAAMSWSISTAAAGSMRYVSPTGDDAADGSEAHPWKTLTHVLNAIPDDPHHSLQIMLADGTYDQTISATRRFAGLCNVRAEHWGRVHFRSPAGQNRVLSCYGAANIVFIGIDMFGSGGTQGEYLVHVGEKSQNILFDGCIIHDGYNNDLVKVNDGAHDITFGGCFLFNQPDADGDELFDINTVTDINVVGCVLFEDYAGSGRKSHNKGDAFIVIKNSGSTPNVTRRIALRGNIFLNYLGKSDEAFVLLGEDGKPFFEAQDITIENNLFVCNSPVRYWGALLFKGGLKHIVVRANTFVGHPNVQWTGGFAVSALRVGANPPQEDWDFSNNFFADPTGNMPRFSMTNADVFAPGHLPMMNNNLYWNAGKPIPTEKTDMAVPSRDSKAISADPMLVPIPKQWIVPRLDPATGKFLSGSTDASEEFQRIVKAYASARAKSAVIGAADPADMPATDILGHKRGRHPDIGCLQQDPAQ